MIYLYHGSNVKIETIDLKKSRPNKDFGRGFYLSADREQAWRMGEFKALTEGGKPVMNTSTHLMKQFLIPENYVLKNLMPILVNGQILFF